MSLEWVLKINVELFDSAYCLNNEIILSDIGELRQFKEMFAELAPLRGEIASNMSPNFYELFNKFCEMYFLSPENIKTLHYIKLIQREILTEKDLI